MISYESKTWVDEIDYPTIKLINDEYYEIYQRNTLMFTGKIESHLAKMILNLNNGQRLTIDFLDNQKKSIQVSRLVDINIEAIWGNFLKLIRITKPGSQ